MEMTSALKMNQVRSVLRIIGSIKLMAITPPVIPTQA
jgi:hypothetical protein